MFPYFYCVSNTKTENGSIYPCLNYEYAPISSFMSYAYKTAKAYHDEKTFKHVKRVAYLVMHNKRIPPHDMDTCISLALMHDLLEDTNYDISCLDKYYIGNNFKECLKLLTKDKNMTYNEYIINIRRNMDKYPNAFWVKLADMEDHLLQTETLTDKLREKYLNAIPYLVI